MESFKHPSGSPPPYSSIIVGAIIGSVAISLVLIIAVIYIYQRGGPKAMLRARRERRKARKNAHDLEMATNSKRIVTEDRERKVVQQQAMETLEGLYQANTLVGLPPPVHVKQNGGSRVGPGKIDEEKCKGEGMDEFVDVALDPMSYT